MRRSLTILSVVVTGVLVLVAGQAFAAGRTSAAKTVTVVMRDPGCHWFAVNGKFTTTMSVRGPVALANDDMATLKVAGHSVVRRDAVGKRIVLARGSYRITMVGQASDDNILRLLVR
jgi:hypothetical protein